MPADTTSASSLSREQVMSMLLKPLEAKSVFLAAGPRIYDTDGSPIRIPKLTAMDAPSFVTEGSAIPEVDATFDEVNLLPSTIKPVSSITRFSNQLARQSVIDLTTALRDRMVLDASAVLDAAFINGTGNGGTTPLGILNYTGVTVAGSAIGTATTDRLYDAVGAALAANVDMGSLRWLMTSRDYIAVHKLKSADGRYLISPDPTDGAVSRLLGYPISVTDRIPGGTVGGTATVVLADFSQIAVARDLAASVTILPERYAEYDQQAIRVVSRWDAAPLNPEAIVKLTGITAWGTA